jgi:hypothetical protein
MSNFAGIVLLFMAVVVLVLGMSLITAWPFMWLWNYAVVSSVTIAKPITYWVAFWLSFFLSFFVLPHSSTSK